MPAAPGPTLPLPDDLKRDYMSREPSVQFTVRRKFDPTFPYKLLRVPPRMLTAKFLALCSREFCIPELEAVLLNRVGDQIAPCHDVQEMMSRCGPEVWIAHIKPLVPSVRAYDIM